MSVIQLILVIAMTVAVIGVVVCEILLGFAMVKKNFRFTTRQVGRWIMAFFLILVVSVTAMMAVSMN